MLSSHGGGLGGREKVKRIGIQIKPTFEDKFKKLGPEAKKLHMVHYEREKTVKACVLATKPPVADGRTATTTTANLADSHLNLGA